MSEGYYALSGLILPEASRLVNQHFHIIVSNPARFLI